ncbi:MAG: hypothetical protein A2497_01300, partial [Candidatus Firestonebacteria bacterium RifOxyC12_full_39_7]
NIVETYSNQKDNLPKLHNTDGEPLLFCKVYFKLINKEAIEVVLNGMENVERDENNKSWVWKKKGKNLLHPNVLIGNIYFENEFLVFDTNSMERSVKFRKLAVKSFKGYISYLRTEEKEFSELKRPSEEKMKEQALKQQELMNNPEVVRQLKQKTEEYYLKSWVRQKIPALGDITPYDAMKSEKGRELLEKLIGEMEEMDKNVAVRNPAMNMNFDLLRAKVGMNKEQRRSKNGHHVDESISEIKTGMNEPCPCGSKEKYKDCCLTKDRVQELDKNSRISGTILDEYMFLIQYVGMYADKERQFSINGEYLDAVYEYIKNAYTDEKIKTRMYDSMLMGWYFLDLKYGIENMSLIDNLLKYGSVSELNSPGPECLRDLAKSYQGFYEIMNVSPREMTVKELVTGKERNVMAYGDTYEKDRKPGEVWFCRLLGAENESYSYGAPWMYTKDQRDNIESNLLKIIEKARENGWLEKMTPEEEVRTVAKNSIIFFVAGSLQCEPSRKEELPFGFFKKNSNEFFGPSFKNLDKDEMFYNKSIFSVSDIFVLNSRLKEDKNFDFDSEINDHLYMKKYKIKGAATNMAIASIKLFENRMECETNSEYRANEMMKLLCERGKGIVKFESHEEIKGIF